MTCLHHTGTQVMGQFYSHHTSFLTESCCPKITGASKKICFRPPENDNEVTGARNNKIGYGNGNTVLLALAT
jgi:hypothetical protein